MTNDEIIKKLIQSKYVLSIGCYCKYYCTVEVSCRDLFLNDIQSIDNIVIFGGDENNPKCIYMVFIQSYKGIKI